MGVTVLSRKNSQKYILVYGLDGGYKTQKKGKETLATENKLPLSIT